MHITMLFSYLKEQKAFTAFLSTLMVVGTVSGVLIAKNASAATQSFQNVSFALDDARANHMSGLKVSFAPGTSIFDTEGATTTTKVGSATASTTITISMTSSAGNSITSADFSTTGLTMKAGAGSCTVGPNNAATPPDAYFGTITNSAPVTIQLVLCPNHFLFEGAAVTPTLTLINSKTITLPAKGIYDARIVTSSSDATIDTFDTKTKYAVTDDVFMTANVDPILSFTVTGVPSATTVGSDVTTQTTSATSTAFATIASGTPQILAQNLNFSTNANGGASVAMQATTNFESANGAIIDGVNNGSTVATNTAWGLPALDVNNDKTWGQIGARSSNTNLSGGMTAGNFSGVPFGMNGVAPAPQTLFGYNRPVPTTVASTTVVYKAQVTDLQEAATDYKTELIYTVTPSF